MLNAKNLGVVAGIQEFLGNIGIEPFSEVSLCASY